MKAIFNKEKNKFELSVDYSLNCVSTDLDCDEHKHDYVEMVYCFSGTALNYVDGISYWMHKGDVLLIDYNSTHAIYPKQNICYCDIMLKPSFFNKYISENSGIMSLFELDEFSQFKFSTKIKKIIHFSIEEQKKVEFLIKTMDDELKHKKFADILMNRSALCMLLTLIFRHMTVEEAVSLNGDLLDYINEHCDERLTESMLAKKCSYSKEYFSRKFKQLAGKTFSQYLCERRLNKARDLLINTRKTVDVILLESGFTSRGEFFKKFEQKFGETPLRYRKNQKSVLMQVNI